jgi:hypothetical protein
VTWWKVSYDCSRPFWTAFGRVAFIRAVSQEEAHTRALRFIGLVEPGATIRRVDLTPSDHQARLRFWQRVQANRTWKRNVPLGIPNDPRSL